VTVAITHYTDPACPFAFSAEPVRARVRWHYGDQLAWRHVMIVLTDGDRHEAELLAGGAPALQRLYGMPIDPAPRRRPASSEPGCRAVVAARLFASAAEEPLLRSLRVRGMAGALLDDPDLIAAAAHDAGLEPGELAGWLKDPRVTEALHADIRAARSPSAVARALDHKLGGRHGARRYSAPSCELASDAGTFTLPGFTPVEALEAAIANLAPALERRPPPRSARELLEWAGEPLATAEILLIMQDEPAMVRAELARTAHCMPAGADAYWTLEPSARAAPGPASPELARAVAATATLP
jgi:2-hydroxychromene-2-carboxylate isomerase